MLLTAFFPSIFCKDFWILVQSQSSSMNVWITWITVHFQGNSKAIYLHSPLSGVKKKQCTRNSTKDFTEECARTFCMTSHVLWIILKAFTQQGGRCFYVGLLQGSKAPRIVLFVSGASGGCTVSSCFYPSSSYLVLLAFFYASLLSFSRLHSIFVSLPLLLSFLVCIFFILLSIFVPCFTSLISDHELLFLTKHCENLWLLWTLVLLSRKASWGLPVYDRVCAYWRLVEWLEGQRRIWKHVGALHIHPLLLPCTRFLLLCLGTPF